MQNKDPLDETLALKLPQLTLQPAGASPTNSLAASHRADAVLTTDNITMLVKCLESNASRSGHLAHLSEQRLASYH